MMNPMAMAALGAIVRHGLTFLASYLVARGIWTETEASTYVLALTTVIVSVGWSQLRAVWDRRKLVPAQAFPGVISEREIERLIATTEKRPPVTMQKDTTPYPVGTANPNFTPAPKEEE